MQGKSVPEQLEAVSEREGVFDIFGVNCCLRLWGGKRFCLLFCVVYNFIVFR